jgi:Leucine-rich repeat (LRR) protein
LNLIILILALQVLFLNKNQLTRLPDTLGNLTRLHQLFLQSNSLSYLPSTIEQLTQLQYIDLNSNKLESIDTNLSKLWQVTSFIAYSNKLTWITPSIQGMRSLKTLDLHDNQLPSLPDEIGELLFLSTLSLAKNQLKSIPSTIGNLRFLVTLDLSQNKLSFLPHELSKLRITSLWIVRASTRSVKVFNQLIICFFLKFKKESNCFEILPSILCEISTLELLSAGHNRIGPSIPPFVSRLCNLTDLLLSDNKIHLLPPEIHGMEMFGSLRRLDLNENPITTPKLSSPLYEPYASNGHAMEFPTLLGLCARSLLAVESRADIQKLYDTLPEELTDLLMSRDNQVICTSCNKACFGTEQVEYTRSAVFGYGSVPIGTAKCWFCRRPAPPARRRLK